MADAFTSTLNLCKPEVGQSRDSWGQKLSANLDLLDAEVAARRAAATSNAANANSRVAKAGDTMTGALTAPALHIDANCYISKSGDTVVVQFDADDALHFARPTNTFAALIGGQNRFSVNATDAVASVPLTLNVAGSAAAHAVRKDYVDLQHSNALGVANQKLALTGGALTGDLTLTRSAAPTTGALFLGNSGSKYLYWDGTSYSMPGGELYIAASNRVWHSGVFPSPADRGNENTFTAKQQIAYANPVLDLHYPGVAIWRLQVNNQGLLCFTSQENAVRFYSDLSGNVVAGNFITTSDERIKAEVRPVADPLLAVEALRGVTFCRNDQPLRRRVGLIAQEVEGIVPEAVLEGADGLKGVDYGGLIAVLVGAVQELSATVRALRGELLDGGDF